MYNPVLNTFRIICIILLISPLILFTGCNKPHPNVLLINVDDMGWRDVGFMGSRYYNTPNIDNLAGKGIIFTDAYAAASNCAPSRASLMTGLWAARHGIYTVGSSERGESRDRKLIPVENRITLPEDLLTLAEALKQVGFKTCHAGKWHLSEDPLDYGFDINIGGNHYGAPESYYPPYGNITLEAEEDKYLTDNIMDHVLAFIQEADVPFFLHYSPYAVHVPIHPVDSLLYKYEEKQTWMGQSSPGYATMLENLDRNIGRLMDEIESGPGLAQTLVFFTSDNGGHFRITRQRPLRSGKGSYYEGGIRVPLAVAWKGRIKGGRVSDAPVSHLDLFPTILDILGVNAENEESYRLDGSSFAPLLLKNNTLVEKPLFWHFPIYLQAYDPGQEETHDSLFRTTPGSVVRVGDWKLHEYFEDGVLELYDLSKDPGETKNLAASHPEKASELLKILEDWRKQTESPVPRELNPEYINENSSGLTD